MAIHAQRASHPCRLLLVGLSDDGATCTLKLPSNTQIAAPCDERRPVLPQKPGYDCEERDRGGDGPEDAELRRHVEAGLSGVEIGEGGHDRLTES